MFRSLTSRRAACIATEALATRRLLCSSTMTSGKVNVRGVDLFYMKNGSVGTPLLCMPGAMGTAETDFGPQCVPSLSTTAYQ